MNSRSDNNNAQWGVRTRSLRNPTAAGLEKSQKNENGSNYSLDNVTLAAISAPDPSGPTLVQSLQDQFLACWPSEFTNFGLYFKTNLSSPTWVSIPGVTNRYLENPLSAPQKFFLLVKP